MISVGDPPVERHAAREQLEEHDAEREEVRPVIDGPPERLLRRHVGHGPDDHARDRHLRLRVTRGLGALGPHELGEAEVEHLDEPALGPHQVRALDVAVHDPAGVRLVQRIGDLQADLDDLADRQRPFRDARRQQFALDILHHDEVGAARLADVVGDGDVRRAEQRGRARLVQQARPAFGIRLEVRRQEFQGDRTAETDILRTIHFAHAAGAKALADAIVLNGRTNQRVHGMSWEPCDSSVAGNPYLTTRAPNRTFPAAEGAIPSKEWACRPARTRSGLELRPQPRLPERLLLGRQRTAGGFDGHDFERSDLP